MEQSNVRSHFLAHDEIRTINIIATERTQFYNVFDTPGHIILCKHTHLYRIVLKLFKYADNHKNI